MNGGPEEFIINANCTSEVEDQCSKFLFIEPDYPDYPDTSLFTHINEFIFAKETKLIEEIIDHYGGKDQPDELSNFQKINQQLKVIKDHEGTSIESVMDTKQEINNLEVNQRRIEKKIDNVKKSNNID